MNPEIDTFVLQDGQNPAFRAYLTVDECNRIIECKGNVEYVNFTNIDKRPIPQSLLEGKTTVDHTLVPMYENICIYLN